MKAKGSQYPSVLIAGLLGLVCVVSGCSSYPVNVSRGRMPEPSPRREGPVSVAAFKDTRPVVNKNAIGAIYNVPFVVQGGTPIESVMQSHLEAALKQVGYVIVSPQAAPVRIEGEVFHWQLEKPAWGQFECRIGVRLRVCDQAGGKVLWERDIQGQEDDLMSRDAAARAAVDVVLANAIREFSSAAFYEAVQRRN